MIRLMTASDKELYFKMSESFYLSGATLTRIDDGKREDFWREILSGELVKAYIFECEGQCAGYAITSLSASQEAGGRILWIDELYVEPRFRMRSLAKDFFKFIEERGERLIRIEVERDNALALSFYRSLGYKDGEYAELYKINEKQ